MLGGPEELGEEQPSTRPRERRRPGLRRWARRRMQHHLYSGTKDLRVSPQTLKNSLALLVERVNSRGLQWKAVWTDFAWPTWTSY